MVFLQFYSPEKPILMKNEIEVVSLAEDLVYLGVIWKGKWPSEIHLEWIAKYGDCPVVK